MHLTWFSIFYSLVVFCLCQLGESGIIIYDGDHEIEEFSDVELPFSHPIFKNGIEGVIISANPPEACSIISGPPDRNSSLNWFVLIAGNFCDYDTKVIYSELAGYSAAIIYSLRGKDDGPYRHPAGSISPISNISAIAVRTSTGLIIKENYLYTMEKRFRILLTINDMHTHWAFSIKKYYLLLTTAAFLIVFFAVPLGIVRFVQQAHSLQSNRLSSRHLRQLQISKFRKGDPYETCAICLEDYKDKDKLRILPCLHGYHAKCIDPWLTNNRRVCPVCKQRVVLAGEFCESDIEYDVENRETTPLLSSSSGRYLQHGTFSDTNLGENALEYHGTPIHSSETTLQNVPSAAFTEISIDDTSNVVVHQHTQPLDSSFADPDVFQNDSYMHLSADACTLPARHITCSNAENVTHMNGEK